MRRVDVERATTNLLAALKATGLTSLLDSIRKEGTQKDRKRDSEPLVKAYAQYIKMSQSFGWAENQLLSVLDLERLNDVDFWSKIIVSDDLTQATAIYDNLQFAEKYLPKIARLLQRESDTFLEQQTQGTRQGEKALERLSVIILEDNQMSSPERLIFVLQSIDELFQAGAQFLGEPDARISVAGCDSGNDKSFDFLGPANIIDFVKEVILSFWDKVVYYRQDTTGRRIGLIADSLPILEKITYMKAAGKIEPERAEIIKRSVVSSITKFAVAGATIPEIEERTYYNPRQLMRPEAKMLVAAFATEGHAKEEPSQKESYGKPIGNRAFEEYVSRVTKELDKEEVEPSSALVESASADESSGPA